MGAVVTPAPANLVLLVDDDPLVRQTLSRVLVRAGFEVVSAGDYEAAICILRRGGVATVVTDIDMPGSNGIDLLRTIRGIDLDLPVLLMTGAPDLGTAMAAVEYGAMRYMPKPFENRDLVAQVQNALRLYRLAQTKREALHLLGGHAGEASDRAGLEACFERCLGAVWIAYQPIIRASDRALYGYEALLRSDSASLPHPEAILDAAARLGRLPCLAAAIRQRLCDDLLDCDPAWTFFVNLHPDDLCDPRLIGPDATPFAGLASRIVLEVTERAPLDNIPDLSSRIAQLRAQGHRIAIDDLGAGYAGLSSFLRVQPDVVKLDMGLTRDVDTDETRRKLVRSMTALCHEIGLPVVAEGVETAEQRDCLCELGCDLLQGYLFARPGPPFVSPNW